MNDSKTSCPPQPSDSDNQQKPQPCKDRPDYLAEVEKLQHEEDQDQREFQELRLKRHKERQEALAQQRKRRLQAAIISCAGACLLFVFILIIRIVLRSPVSAELTVEAGTTDLTASDFLINSDSGINISFVTDISEISFDHVGTYSIDLKAKGRERKSTLIIQDTEAPTATGKSTTLNLGGELSAEELVTDISDSTDVTCTYKETPDYSEEGTVRPSVILTDEGGNTTEVTCTVTVMLDEEAPVIDGVAHLSAFIDVPVSYKSNITVTDNCDEEVSLTVDTSSVNPDEEGTYEITYTAADRAGNTSTASATITFTEKPEDYIDEETVLAEAQEILDEIVTEDMTLKQKTKAIYDWVRSNITYASSTYKESWTNGAHIGFTTGAGDCYIFFATTKALLTQAGIPNIDIEKSNVTRSHHYWSLVNVGDGWYHLDTTPRESGATFFLVTDAEMIAYFEAHNTPNPYDTSLYPATPTTPSAIE